MQDKISIFNSTIQDVIKSLSKRESVEVQGQSKYINYWYSIWKGKPDWLKYTIYVCGQEIEATYLTLNTPRYISKAWANNYASEDTQITIPDKTSNERLQEILFGNNVFGKWNSFVDSFMGLGCGAMVVNADLMTKVTTEGKDKQIVLKPNPSADVKINFVGGRRVYPITIEDGEVTECAFVIYKTGGVKLVIHFKREDGCYTIAEVEGIEKNGEYAFDTQNIAYFDTTTKDKLFMYWKPNNAEEDDIENGVGESCFQGAIDTFKQCDLAYTALWKEINLGQKQLYISSDVDIVDENGNHVNPIPRSEGIIEIPSGTDGKTVLQEFSAQLRIQDLIKNLNTHLNCAAMLCGLGQSVFEFESTGGRPMQTAKQVTLKQTDLYRNVKKQENFADCRFRELVYAIMYVNNEMTSKPKIKLDRIQDIKIVYDDNIIEDTESKRDRDLREVSAGIRTTAEYRADWFDEADNDALDKVHELGLDAIKYLPVLQAGGMSLDKFVEIVWGSDSQELARLQEANKPVMDDLNYDESDDDNEEEPSNDEDNKNPIKEKNESEA